MKKQAKLSPQEIDTIDSMIHMGIDRETVTGKVMEMRPDLTEKYIDKYLNDREKQNNEYILAQMMPTGRDVLESRSGGVINVSEELDNLYGVTKSRLAVAVESERSRVNADPTSKEADKASRKTSVLIMESLTILERMEKVNRSKKELLLEADYTEATSGDGDLINHAKELSKKFDVKEIEIEIFDDK